MQARTLQDLKEQHLYRNSCLFDLIHQDDGSRMVGYKRSQDSGGRCLPGSLKSDQTFRCTASGILAHIKNLKRQPQSLGSKSRQVGLADAGRSCK